MKHGLKNTYQGQRNPKHYKSQQPRLRRTDRLQEQGNRTAWQTADLGEPPEFRPEPLGPGGGLEWHLTTWAKPPRAKGFTDSAPGGRWNKIKEVQSQTCKNQKKRLSIELLFMFLF